MAKEKKQLFDAPTESTGPVECLGMTFESDEARRAYFTEKLREKLKDPEFRKIEGFPIGEDEDILAMSDPPYYTACPNPFFHDLAQFVAATRLSHGDTHQSTQPFAFDVSEGKNHPIYNAHSYHTKVPHRAIMRYLLHYTQPGDLVYDGFCGTGMAGVAASLCGNRQEVESLGFTVGPDGTVTSSDGLSQSTIGSRYAALADLGPSASFIAYNYNAPVGTDQYAEATESLVKRVEDECGWMFATLHKPSPSQMSHAIGLLPDSASSLDDSLPLGRINYLIWSEVFTCPECAGELIFWDAAVDLDNGKVLSSFPCPSCKSHLTKRSLERAWVTYFDQTLNTSVRQAKYVPALVNYTFGGKRYEKQADDFDRSLVELIERQSIPYWFPAERLPDGEEARRNDSIGLTHVHHFYTRRNLWVLAALQANGLQYWLPFSALTPRATKMHRIAASRLGGEKKGVGGATVGVIAGTLYVPSLSVEMNVLDQARDRVSAVAKAKHKCATTFVTTQSATDMRLLANSVDYIFTDPPFGGNIMYSELSFLWESWLNVFTNNESEAVVNRVQRKGLFEYEQLMSRCFAQCYTLLKPGRWMTVEFHNSQNRVWNAIQEALQQAGFVVADVRTLDKKQGTFKQITGAGAVKQDLIITAYKPNGGLEDRFRLEAGTQQGAWDFVETHLRKLPVFVGQSGRAELIAERQKYLLFDRMVAFHVQRGATVPMSASEFYLGLSERFPEREGMHFLPDQVSEYDKLRSSVTDVVQLELFVSDEATAIQWLKQQLQKKPQTFQELQPQFMREVGGWGKHEKPLELVEMLDQNFLSYDGKGEVPSQIHSYLSSNFHELRNLEKDDPKLIAKAKNRWYVPDPRKEADLEKIRHRALMKEFNEYVESKGKLKVVRTEALRAGFKECWQSGDYKTIVGMAKRVKDDIIQEDPALLMYYDNALMRAEG